MCTRHQGTETRWSSPSPRVQEAGDKRHINWTTSGSYKVTFVVAQITFKMASVADISLLDRKITFVVAEIIIKEDVIICYVAKITFIVAEIICKVAVVTSSVALVTFVVDEIT